MRRVMSWLMVLLMACPVQATQWLKQSTAVTVKIGPFVDSTDGITPETGLTISQADIRLSKNGGDFAQTHNAAGSTHDENGWHDVPLDTTDTGTLGTLDLAIYESGAAPVFRNYMVVTANVWDSMFGADYLQVDRIQVGGTANATATIANAFGGSTFQAASDVKTTMEASGSSLANILEDTGTTLPATLTTIAGYTDGIETKTNNLPASPAAVGSAMNLADDAITAAKFDESTAFPLKSADTGSTAVARTGADSDTLETLSDQIDGVGSAADPWALTASGYSAGTFGYIVMNTASMDDVNDAMASDGVVAALQAGLATAVYVADMNDAIRGDIAGIEAGSGLTAQETRDAMKLAPSAGAAASGSIDAVIADILTDTGTTLDGRIPAALVSGRMDASVGAMANNVLTSSAINADAITAAKMAADVTTELQTGLATAAQATAIETDTQDLQAQIGTDGAGLTAIGDTRIANLDAAVSSRATAAELAKVPKSDGTASWNATALSAINAEVDTALNTAIPGSPTADSINERIVAIDAYGAPPTAAAIKTAIEADGSKIDHLWEMTEDNSGTRRLTAASMAGALSTYDVPTETEMNARSLASASYATSSAQTTAQGTLTKVETMLQSDGATGYEYTAQAMSNVSATVEGEVTVASASVTAIQSGLATAAYVADMNDAIRADIADIDAGSGASAADVVTAMEANGTKLDMIYDKLPSKTYLTGTANADGDIQANEATGNFPGTVAKSPATLATGDVTGNLPADVKAYTVQPTVTGATLSSAYDAAKTAASAADVATALGTYDVPTLAEVTALVPTGFGDLEIVDGKLPSAASVTLTTEDVQTIAAAAQPQTLATTVAAGTPTVSSFVLTNGPATDGYFGERYWFATVIDATTGMPGGAIVDTYTGSTKTVTMETALPFTPEAGDAVYIMPLAGQAKWSR